MGICCKLRWLLASDGCSETRSFFDGYLDTCPVYLFSHKAILSVKLQIAAHEHFWGYCNIFLPHHAVAVAMSVQIMLVLTQKHERPELPPLETLPGQPLPGIEDYLQLMQDCWHEDPSKRPRFEDIIISLRGLLESAANRHKLQKTLTGIAAPLYIIPSPHSPPSEACAPQQHQLQKILSGDCLDTTAPTPFPKIHLPKIFSPSPLPPSRLPSPSPTCKVS